MKREGRHIPLLSLLPTRHVHWPAIGKMKETHTHIRPLRSRGIIESTLRLTTSDKMGGRKSPGHQQVREKSTGMEYPHNSHLHTHTHLPTHASTYTFSALLSLSRLFPHVHRHFCAKVQSSHIVRPFPRSLASFSPTTVPCLLLVPPHTPIKDPGTGQRLLFPSGLKVSTFLSFLLFFLSPSYYAL